MPRGRRPRHATVAASSDPIADVRHPNARRKNNPPAGLATTYEITSREPATHSYAYDPHLDPQLMWAGKAEHTSFEVEVCPLHIHERISSKAILAAVRRPQPCQPDLFAETPLSPEQQVDFYRHEVGWANRLILGDSLLVMNSLLVKEGMAGKVQMVYIDPPYGIKYSSNFQPRLDRRDVKDQDEDLTHEPEQIKAYRDTWKLGIHSYLTYLRDRLLLARELLTESGSIFVQINDENLHLVRCLLDEVFGRENFVSQISFRTKIPLRTTLIANVHDYLLWYARSKDQMKFRKLYTEKGIGDEGRFSLLQMPDGSCRYMMAHEKSGDIRIPEGAKPFVAENLNSAGRTESCVFDFEYEGRIFRPTRGKSWKTNLEGMKAMGKANRLFPTGNNLYYVLFHEDYPVQEISNVWNDTRGEMDKSYAVQTTTKVIERCILMSTDPGDLVLDPTCGSGTTAYCAEKWGRRWITCDTSRVALAIARQRLMTAKYDYYELRDPERGPAGGFVYETVPHITLESIAKNTEIDEIAARYQPQIDQALSELNAALGKDWKEWEVPPEVPHPAWPETAREAYWRLRELQNSLRPEDRAKAESLLEEIYRETGHRWELSEIPEPVPPADWPESAKEALRRFWQLKRAKRREIDESIQRNAPQETLYDRPQVVRGVVRVSGPFTVEAIPVPAVEDPTQTGATAARTDEESLPLLADSAALSETGRAANRGGDYLAAMISLLQQQGGVLFPGGKKLELTNIRPLSLGYLHAEAEAKQNGGALRVAISFGPPHGPIIARQVQEAVPTAKKNGYQMLIFAGFAFDPESQALLEKAPVAGLQVHFAHVAPDVLVGDLLRTNRASQIFTVFGQPDVALERRARDGKWVAVRTAAYAETLRRDGFPPEAQSEWRVELRGVDVYDPVSGEVLSLPGNAVAAWFVDTDYNGLAFKISQAFFPGTPDAWEKLQRALKAEIDPEAFDKMRGTVSFPFTPGEHQRIAVKVIDFRGNEVVRVMKLRNEEPYHA